MLNSRERCIRAISHEDVDRIPLTFNARPEVVSRLIRRLGCRDNEELLEALHVDERYAPPLKLESEFLLKNAKLKEGPYGPACTIRYQGEYEVRRDVWGIESVWAPSHTYTYTFVKHPLQEVSLEEYTWPKVVEESAEAVRKYCKVYGERYLVVGYVTHLFEIAWQLTGFNQLIRLMYENPSYVDRILDGLDKIRFEEAKLLIDAGVDVIYDGDDAGAQTTMIISPFLWRRHLKRRYKQLADLCHKHGVFLMFHSDGWIEPIVPDLVEIGVDILDPVQPECMDPAEIHDKYGDKLCLHGTISVQSTLPFGKREDVINEVKKRIEKIGLTGIILGPTHAIQPDTPLENILTLYEAAIKYGKNPERNDP